PPCMQLRHRPGLLETGALHRLAEEADGDDDGQAADNQGDNQRGRQNLSPSTGVDIVMPQSAGQLNRRQIRLSMATMTRNGKAVRGSRGPGKYPSGPPAQRIRGNRKKPEKILA